MPFQAGQALMAVRSLTEIWIDANFKETQLANLRIGQRVRCEVDMCGSRREFEGRITGFTMGTGQTLSLLPPQYATGNFVKIVQRLPVRVELTDYDPAEVPLFVGLTLGGWLCVDYNWRWIFLVNVPLGVVALVAAHAVVHDPDYLKRERAELSRQPLNFDSIGLSLLVLVMCCWEIMLSKGEEWDWLGDPFGRVQTLAVLFVLGLGLLIFREMRTKSPIIDFRVLGERNFAVCCVILFCAYAVVYCASMALPSLLQGLFGYDALRSGLAMSPSGVSSMAAMVVAGFLMGRQMDARWLIAAGLLVMAVGNYAMARMNLQVSPWDVIWPRMLLTLGLGLLFAPANVAAYKYIPVQLRGAAVGLLSLLRTEGGSVGTSMANTIHTPRQQFHLSRLGEHLTPLNPHVQSYMERAQEFFLQRTGDSAGSERLGVKALDSLRQQQAASLAFFDVFWLCALLSAALVLLVVLMKRSVAEKGEHIGAE